MAASVPRILALLVLLTWSYDARACMCDPADPAVESAEAADVVFVGRAVEYLARYLDPETEWSAGSRMYSVAFRFETLVSFKDADADPHADEIVVLTGEGGGDCGYPFRLGATYLVYGYRRADGVYVTTHCSRTRELQGADKEIADLSRHFGNEPIVHHAAPAAATPPPPCPPRTLELAFDEADAIVAGSRLCGSERDSETPGQTSTETRLFVERVWKGVELGSTITVVDGENWSPAYLARSPEGFREERCLRPDQPDDFDQRGTEEVRLNQRAQRLDDPERARQEALRMARCGELTQAVFASFAPEEPPASDSIEPKKSASQAKRPAPSRAAPNRGGCAGCSLASGVSPPPWLLLVSSALLWTARSRRSNTARA